MQVLEDSIYIWPVIAFIGACFGSFISLLSYRLPRNLPVLMTRSACPHCQHPLGVADLVPILSLLWSRLRCRYCKQAISLRYQWIEWSTMAAALVVYAQYGLTLEAACLFVLCSSIITLMVTDLEHYMIPDSVQLAIFFSGLAYALVTHANLPHHLACAAGLFGLGLMLHYGYFWLKKQHGLGFGDVKLLGASGIWLTLEAIPAYLFTGGLLGVVLALIWRQLGRGEIFPFGPALAFSLLLILAGVPRPF